MFVEGIGKFILEQSFVCHFKKHTSQVNTNYNQTMAIESGK